MLVAVDIVKVGRLRVLAVIDERVFAACGIVVTFHVYVVRIGAA